MLTISQMRESTGMVMPVWYPEDMSPEAMAEVFAPCLVDVDPFAKPENVVVIVDGNPRALQAVQRVRARFGAFEVLCHDQNQGKAAAVATGIERLLANKAVQLILVRDSDNDHLVNDSLNVANLTDRMRRELGHDLVVGIGRRVNVHRHLGFTRGEYEWLVNEVCFEAAKFALAREERVVNTSYCAAYDFVPDMQTGFKCYTRATAQLFLDSLRQSSTLTPGLDLRRYGAEIPVLVETLLRGGALGEITRAAWESQPLTTFDLAGRMQVKGTVLAWALRRTEVPLSVARQLLLNSIARRSMTKEAKGQSDLLALANWSLEKLAGFRQEKFRPIAELRLAEYF